MTGFHVTIREALAQAAGDEFDAALAIVRQLRHPDVCQAILIALQPRLKLRAPNLRQAIEAGPIPEPAFEAFGAEARAALVRALLDVIREEKARRLPLTRTWPTA